MTQFDRALEHAGFDPAALDDTGRCIALVRERIPASVLHEVAKSLPVADMIPQALNITPAALESESDRAITSQQTEALIDLIRTFRTALAIWPETSSARQWFDSPIPALDGQCPTYWIDTFEGRRWVRSTLAKIEDGDFS